MQVLQAQLLKFEQFIQKQAICQSFAANEKVLVCVSGGADSVLLLHLLKLYTSWDLIVCHTNHQLRSASSDSDEVLVRNYAQEHNLPIYVQVAKPITLSEDGSYELEARNMRRAFQDELCAVHQINWVATGHHLTDSFETALINLIRGTGITGLRGIPFRNGNRIHPLLCFTKQEVEELCKELGLSFNTDASNTDTSIRRNQLRLEVLPILKAMNPNLEHTFAANALRIEAIDDYLNTTAEYAINSSEIELERINDAILPELWLRKQNDGSSYANYLNACQTANDLQTGEKVQIGSTFWVRDRNLLLKTEAENHYQITLNAENQWQYQGPFFQIWKLANIGNELIFDSNYLHLEEHQITNLIVRNWLPGDYVLINQGRSKKKVSDILTDAKVSAALKPNWPVITNSELAGEVIWVPGVRLSDTYHKRNFACPVSFGFAIAQS
jgi:tRNA(Ile)-lysidine synthase